MHQLRYPDKARSGDRVAVLSPSSGLAAAFPHILDLGLQRLRELGLDPVEYPSTRHPDASPRARAEDVHAAFADASIAAVLTTIGGDDQIKVLRHLDPDLLAAHPKPFFGYSDSTNLLHYLWNLGIVGYHGCAVMTHLARGGRMHPTTRSSLRAALFGREELELLPAKAWTDEDRDWNNAASLEQEPPLLPRTEWRWHGPRRVVTGPSWGGCLEIVDLQLRAGRYLRPVEDYAGAVLLLETSEEAPPASVVQRSLMGMGERGLLSQFAAVVVGRPKAWSFDHPRSADEREQYAMDQAAAVVTAVQEYNPDAPVVIGVDIGHTDPQYVVPHGGLVTVDGVGQRVRVRY